MYTNASDSRAVNEAVHRIRTILFQLNTEIDHDCDRSDCVICSGVDTLGNFIEQAVRETFGNPVDEKRCMNCTLSQASSIVDRLYRAGVDVEGISCDRMMERLTKRGASDLIEAIYKAKDKQALFTLRDMLKNL